MRDFSKFAPTFWTGITGKQIRELGVDAQLLAVYLFTNPHTNMFGLYYLPLPFINHETAISLPKISAALVKLQSIGFCRYDKTSEYIWVLEMAGFQIGDLKPEDNRFKALPRAWQGLPSNPFIGDFFEKYGLKYGLERRAYKGLMEPSGSPQIIERETETERERDISQGPSPSPAGLPPKFLFDLWNKMAPQSLARASLLSDSRKRTVTRRLQENPDAAFWVGVMNKVRGSPLLRGDVPRQDGSPWKATFDWILNPTNLTKIIEGNYDDTNNRSQKPSSFMDRELHQGDASSKVVEVPGVFRGVEQT